MSQFWCTGPAHIHVGIGNNGSPVYLGTTETGVQVQETFAYENVMNDMHGPSLPMEMAYNGRAYALDGQFNRYNENVYQRLVSMPFPQFTPAAGNITSGSERQDYTGTFMVQEGAAYPIWVSTPYGGTHAAMAQMGRGRRYLKAVMHPVTWMASTRSQKKFMAWVILPVFKIDGQTPLFNYWDNVGLDALTID